jgi:hypothetical protein
MPSKYHLYVVAATTPSINAVNLPGGASNSIKIGPGFGVPAATLLELALVPQPELKVAVT